MASASIPESNYRKPGGSRSLRAGSRLQSANPPEPTSPPTPFSAGEGSGEYKYVPVPSNILEIMKGKLKKKWKEVAEARFEAVTKHSEYYTKVMANIGYNIPEKNPTLDQIITNQINFEAFMYAFLGARLKTKGGQLFINEEAIDYILRWDEQNL